ncbi:MAG: Asp23/Gls24 family envelope stress response protein [Clostridia bacterium]|nr:Asp23/Gls24 family envelope stress response protein [Clostridia bacterium]
MTENSITISDKAIAALAERTATETDGVIALTDRYGDTRRGRVYITKDRRLEIFIVCRYGANTNSIYKSITSRLGSLLGNIGGIAAVDVRIVGIGE